MITVQEAEQIILSGPRTFGTETIRFDAALSRVLAAPITADRDLPPCDRATMDGIAIAYAAWAGGIRSYRVAGILAAGDAPPAMADTAACVELMTGAAVPDALDTVIRYEDLELRDGVATMHEITVQKGQNIHFRGRDRRAGEVLASAPQRITPVLISMAASVGATELTVARQPRVVIVSTGDELVAPEETPGPYRIRRSNSYTLQAALQLQGLQPQLRHLPDNPETLRRELGACLAQYDVLLLSGGVSMGKYDHVPQVLGELRVEQLFHKVRQRPGKPFWFGRHPSGVLVFAFPGNPVSAFMCLHRYFLPWLKSACGLPATPPLKAMLATGVTFRPPLQYFLQVRLSQDEGGRLLAHPVPGGGSGDFVNLGQADAFMELPAEETNFPAGGLYPVWPFQPLFT